MARFTPERIAKIAQLGQSVSDSTIFMHEAIARKAGLSGADHKYLNILLRHGPMTAGTFAKHSGLTTGAVTALLDRLEKKKLIHRSFDKLDRRKIIVTANEILAKKLMGSLNTSLQSQVVNLLKGYSERDVRVIEHYLNAIIDVMQGFTKTISQSKSK